MKAWTSVKQKIIYDQSQHGFNPPRTESCTKKAFSPANSGGRFVADEWQGHSEAGFSGNCGQSQLNRLRELANSPLHKVSFQQLCQYKKIPNKHWLECPSAYPAQTGLGLTLSLQLFLQKSEAILIFWDLYASYRLASKASHIKCKPLTNLLAALHLCAMDTLSAAFLLVAESGASRWDPQESLQWGQQGIG